jgi:hypothetical protein
LAGGKAVSSATKAVRGVPGAISMFFPCLINPTGPNKSQSLPATAGAAEAAEISLARSSNTWVISGKHTRVISRKVPRRFDKKKFWLEINNFAAGFKRWSQH